MNQLKTVVIPSNSNIFKTMLGNIQNCVALLWQKGMSQYSQRVSFLVV